MPKKPTPFTRLPLPGDRPTTVYQHRRRVTQPRTRLSWIWRLLPFVALALLIATGAVVWQLVATPATVVINGEPVDVRTHRRTVAGALRAAGVRPGTDLFTDPAPEARLRPGMVITVAGIRPVTITADGQTLTVDTHHIEPAQIAEAAGITLGEHDAALVERATRPTASEIEANPALAGVPAVPRQIRVQRGRTVIVNEVAGGSTITVSFQTGEPTLGQALIAAGYALYEGDHVEPALRTPLPPEVLEVTLTRGTPVTVHADGQIFTVRTHATTTDAVLAELGLAPVGQDYVLDAPITPGALIRLVRVREETVIHEEPIPFETTYLPQPDLLLDTLVEQQPGREGTLARQVTYRYEDDQLVSSYPGGMWVAEQPRPQVVGYGTRIAIREVMTEAGPVPYWRQLRMLATSYSPSTAGDKKPGDPFFGLSGTGDPMQRGIVATDPRVLPLYTTMWIPDYGFAEALDVGGAVKGMRIDLGYDDENLVLWNNWVEVYLTLPIPPADQIVWILPDAEILPAEILPAETGD
ncbi:MAG: DUF348 domain-containing protein [Chloroflexi bacterium]|nr:DUF348 domain-containing protein [Chloroflexota bacterium]